MRNKNRQLLVLLVGVLICCWGNLRSYASGAVAIKPTTIHWATKQFFDGNQTYSRFTFTEADHSTLFNYLPVIKVQVEDNPVADLVLTGCVYKDLSAFELQYVDTNLIESVCRIERQTGKARAQTIVSFTILPFRKVNGKYQRLEKYGYRILGKPLLRADQSNKKAQASAQPWAPSSVLASGDWYKVSITNSGLYKLDYNYFQTVLGINPASIDPRNIKLYGHGGAMLPRANGVLRPADLPELRIAVIGESDGRFDQGDYVLFYGQGPHVITANTQNRTLGHQNNFYADAAFYYLTVAGDPGLRVQQSPTSSPGLQTLTTVDHLQFFEKDLYNLLKSGTEWWGDNFDFVLSRNYSFEASNLAHGTATTIRLNTLATGLRCVNGPHRSTFTVSAGGASLGTITQQHNCPYSLAVLGYPVTSTFTSTSLNGGFDINLRYDKNGFNEAVGYLNWIEVQTRRNARMTSNYLELLSFESLSQPTSTFVIENADQNLQVWDVTNTLNITGQPIAAQGSNISFDFNSDILRRFVAFSDGNFPSPQYIGRQPNQNLHALNTPDLIIITVQDFVPQAERLAQLRRKEGLTAAIVTTDQIYNEYSSGRQDLVAIRDFLRSLYFKNPAALKYVLLFGDCSFDYKNRIPNNTNFVPTFESFNSLNPINSYNSDDFLALLDDNEGEWREWQLDLADVGVGRLVVKNATEAEQVVDKFYSYANKPSNMRNWRQRAAFIADNGDGCLHCSDADAVARQMESLFPDFNARKVYVGAFPVQSSPLGSVSPAAKSALDAAVNQGSLIVNYAGHGNEFQWTSEQILTMDGIKRDWRNPDNLSFFITATCDFGRYDDATLTSGGEYILLAPDNCGIGLVTTTRPVYASNNARLNQAFARALLTRSGKVAPRMGDVIRVCKNSSLISVGVGQDDPGNRSFTLLCDPSLRLAFPRYRAAVDSMKNQAGRAIDTVRALERVTLIGSVYDDNDNVKQDFNGTVVCTFYDKSNRMTFRDSDGNCNFSYDVRNSIIYSGQATVKNGKYQLSFVAPLDINYVLGQGKISIYAKDDSALVDAGGADLTKSVGGSNEIVGNDDAPPLLASYINDTTFVSGGFASPDALYLAKVKDESGINLATSGIGHEMLLTIDNDQAKTYNVNAYYLADPNTFKSGWVKYPMVDLTPGKHTAKLTVWDTYNNSSTTTIDFIVAGGKTPVLVRDFSVYPNPVIGVGRKANFKFTHSLAGQDFKASVEVYNSIGQRINTVSWNLSGANSVAGQEGELSWDLTTASGQVISGGTYFLKLTVEDGNGQKSTSTTRLTVQP